MMVVEGKDAAERPGKVPSFGELEEVLRSILPFCFAISATGIIRLEPPNMIAAWTLSTSYSLVAALIASGARYCESSMISRIGRPLCRPPR